MLKDLYNLIFKDLCNRLKDINKIFNVLSIRPIIIYNLVKELNAYEGP